ncbi:NFACT RNA binding domain-containing protein [Lactiplantibacillus argentoratensis]|uniref:NFACT RNA binding domain-containing protein n=1 Tax=Lactiplantibacillus argentoratensis TaxID=271881 RepID=UPI001CE04BF0|nr:NFACT RNA binding domain-containing protein [Lactiplantibacillus argentoratensis]MCA5597390.1 NFACT RNA binding domain-containing protein [Lactiplantibacillus argentoratensis]
MTTTTDVDLVQTGLAHLIHHTRKQIESLTKALDHLPDVSELQLKGTLLKTYASQIEGHHHFVELPDYQGHPLSIKLDIKKSIIENAEDYFHRYHKSKRGQATIQQNLAMAKTELHQQLATQAAFDPENPEAVATLKQSLIAAGAIHTHVLHSSKAPIPAHPRRFYTHDHVLVEVGKNSRQNDHLTLTARKDYYWMHAGGEIPGSHVVIHSNHPSEQTLQEAAVLTAYYSKGRQMNRVPVDVLTVGQMRKPKGAKAGLVTFSGPARTITVVPDATLAAELRDQEDIHHDAD